MRMILIAGTMDVVEETVSETVETVNAFQKFIQDKGPSVIAFGIQVLLALGIFFIGHKLINWVRKVVRTSMEPVSYTHLTLPTIA